MRNCIHAKKHSRKCAETIGQYWDPLCTWHVRQTEGPLFGGPSPPITLLSILTHYFSHRQLNSEFKIKN